MGLVVSNIQHFSLHDGPGIRTTVFLKGCSIRCPWCCNPENLSAAPNVFVQESRCLKTNALGGGMVAACETCPFALHGAVDGLSVSDCPAGAIGVYGRTWEPDELIGELLRDAAFYAQSDGGITFSGGEPLLQAKALAPVMERLHDEGIDLCMESCLFAPTELLEAIIPLLDRIIFDVKILEPQRCRGELGGDVSLYRQNALAARTAVNDVTLRFPVVPGLTDTPGNIPLVAAFVSDLMPDRVEIFGVHNLGQGKYASMGMPYEPFDAVPQERLEEVAGAIAERYTGPLTLRNL